MAASSYIPVGRTSLVKRGDVDVQVQTEYATRPSPRVTTTLSFQGRVLHKVERALDRAVGTFEEQRAIEQEMRQQHDEILGIIQKDSYVAAMKLAPRTPESERRMTAYDRLLAIPDVERVFRVDNDGALMESQPAEDFQKTFALIFKNLADLMNLFARMPGPGGLREQGVYEIERSRLYFASIGTECFFIVVDPSDLSIDYERLIKGAVTAD
ncbi:MAG: hypothetical protein RBT76_11410 [candidate division Zixibacteria bacterium]|jgi:hypothetical protein|nr:hypothetical protein [candidate division Zixibacteria bacterium]